jgi:hypothetical protein
MKSGSWVKKCMLLREGKAHALHGECRERQYMSKRQTALLLLAPFYKGESIRLQGGRSAQALRLARSAFQTPPRLVSSGRGSAGSASICPNGVLLGALISQLRVAGAAAPIKPPTGVCRRQTALQ